MLRMAGVFIAVMSSGCIIGDLGPGGDDGDGDGSGSGSGEEQWEETGVDLIGRICTMQMKVTGSFVQSVAPPLNPDGTAYEGCWPIGTWTFAVEPGASDCMATPEPLEQYQFKGDLLTDTDGQPYQKFTYMTDPSVRHRLKVSQGGDGLCEGELNLISSDGLHVWIIKPELYADRRLGGEGEYALYKEDQWWGDP